MVKPSDGAVKRHSLKLKITKRQKGKCGHFKLFFKSDDQIENHHRDKNQEPDAIKVARPVLKPSAGGNPRT